MKPCTRCSNTLSADAAYCYVCNTDQNAGFEEFEPTQKQSDTFLKVLCYFTIAGVVISLMSIVNSLVKDAEPLIEGIGALIYINFGITAGKLIGAVLMLKKKLNGLYVYTVAAILGFISMMYSLSLTWKYMESVDEGPVIMILTTFFAVLIVVGFIAMYWLPVNRKHLS